VSQCPCEPIALLPAIPYRAGASRTASRQGAGLPLWMGPRDEVPYRAARKESLLDVGSNRTTDLVWYPGSGLDAGPCLTDVPRNPMGAHLLRPNGEGTLRLWMSDCDSDVIGQFDRDTPNLYGFEDPDAWRRLRVRSLGCVVVERRRVPEWTDARHFTQRADSNIRPPQWDVVRAHVTVGRRDRDDSYEVFFSPFESEAMLRFVFPQVRARLYALVLLRMGGIGERRDELNHHNERFVALVRNTVGLPQYVATDRDDSAWTREPYHFTGNQLVGWKFSGGTPWHVRLFKLGEATSRKRTRATNAT